MKRSPAIRISRKRVARRKDARCNYTRSRVILLSSLALLMVFLPGVAAQPKESRPTVSPVASPFPTPSAGPNLSEDESWATYLIQENPLYGMALVVMGIFAVALLGNLIVPAYLRRLRERRAPHRRKPLQVLDDIYPARVRAKLTEPEVTKGVEVPNLTLHRLAVTPTGKQPSDSQPATKKERQGVPIADLFYPLKQTPYLDKLKPTPSMEGTLDVPVTRRSAIPTFASVEDLNNLKREIAELSAQLRAQSHEPPTIETQPLPSLDEPRLLEQQNAERLTALERKVADVLSCVEVILVEQQGRIHAHTLPNEELEQISDENRNLRTEIVEIREQLQQLKDGNNQTAAANSFYDRTLGTVLGQNIESLQAGNFEQVSQQVGERLNQFFQLEVPHGDILKSLRLRAQSLSVSLKEVVAQVARTNSPAVRDLSSHLQRAEALAADLESFQVQLQNRRATIETRLSVPVSLHAGARQTFLDQLGRGIRHEIDKLSEPQRYFANELKRLVTNDIISVVEVCDSIAHPGTRPELESALGLLFMHAGLRPILPRPSEPVRLAEHEIVNTLPGGTGKSKSIAQVIKRGFYYCEEDSETLLRKCRVAVYR